MPLRTPEPPRTDSCRLLATAAVALAIAVQFCAYASGQAVAADEALGSITGKELLAHVKFLADPSFNGRSSGTKGCDSAAKYLVAQFKKTGVSEPPSGTKNFLQGTGETLETLQRKIDGATKPASVDLPGRMAGVVIDIQRRTVPTYNVVAFVEGGDPVLKSEVVIVGAHYDHIGLGEYGSRLGASGRGKVHPGADDNASGTAGVLEIAQAFLTGNDRPRRSIVFVAFTGEERGLLGSEHYAACPCVPLQNTAAMINLDMISRGPEGVASVSFAGTWEKWKQIIDEAAAATGVRANVTSAGSGASDHAPFYRAKVPCLFFFAGLHPDYHTPGDTWDKANPKTMEGVTRLAYLAALAAADHPERPVFSEPKSDDSALPYLGITPGREIKDEGLRIDDVAKDSPAAKSGMRKGDILAEFDGRQVRTFQDLRDALALKAAGDEAKVVVIRGGVEVELNVKLESRPG